MTTSAYLSIFDDWSLLGPAMAQIAGRVDEIVVVDGAYEWVAPFFAGLGRDPSRSDPRVHDALAPFGAKIRVVPGIWANEMEKRIAGYAACRHRWAWRVDADEILFMDDAALDRFFTSGKAVAEMEMPIVAAPGWMRRLDGQATAERQALIFDRDQISARDHLAYLWLVLPSQERAQLKPPMADAVFAEPVAFNAHLTHWRPPETAISRARFYVLNYLREGHGIGWAPGFRYHADAGFAPLFAAVPPGAITGTLMGHSIVGAAPDMAGAHLLPIPLPAAEQAVYAPLWDAFLAGLAAANAALAEHPRWLHRGEQHCIDMTTPAAAAPFGSSNMHVTFGDAMGAVQAAQDVLLDHAPWVQQTPLPVELAGHAASIELPPFPAGAIRRTVRLAGWQQADAPFTTLRAG